MHGGQRLASVTVSASQNRSSCQETLLTWKCPPPPQGWCGDPGQGVEMGLELSDGKRCWGPSSLVLPTAAGALIPGL